MNNYWAIRINRAEKSFLFKEFQNGRLRQGWGSLPSQSLFKIQLKRDARLGLSPDELKSWKGNRRLLSTEPDGIRINDIILTPHIAGEGLWSLSRVIGTYSFDIDKELGDYGHVLPIEPIEHGIRINPNCQSVHAALRGSMRSQSRMWSLNALRGQMDQLVADVRLGKDLIADDGWTAKLVRAQKSMIGHLDDLLTAGFRGAEFERPVRALLERIYDKVEPHGGPSERGADFLCTFTDRLGINYNVVVQVKKWDGHATWEHPLQQIEDACSNYPKVSSAVLLTTAKSFGEQFRIKCDQLSEKLEIPILPMTANDTMSFFLRYLPELIETRVEID